MSRKLDNYLRTHRKRAGLTQKELAYLLGCKEDAKKVSRYECRTRRPGLSSILAYEAFFGIPSRELFAGLYEKVERETFRRVRVLMKKLRAAEPSRLTAHKLAALKAIAGPADEQSIQP